MTCNFASRLSYAKFWVKNSLWGRLSHCLCNNLPQLYLQCIELCGIFFGFPAVNCNLYTIYRGGRLFGFAHAPYRSTVLKMPTN